MNVSITGEEVIAEQRRIIGDLQHELMMMGITNRKLSAELEPYKVAEAEKNAAALEEKPLRRVSAAVETYPPQTLEQTATAP